MLGMLTKQHKILIGVLAAQLVLVLVMMSRGSDTSAKKAEPLVPNFDAAKVTKIAVYAKDGAKPTVELAKRGASWVVASAFDYPASADKASELLTSVAKLAAAAPIATQASHHKQLHVDDADFERKLVIAIDGHDTTLYVGGPAGSRRTAVRLGGDANVYAVTGLDAWTIGQTPHDWVDPSYVKVVKDELAKVTIARGDRTAALDRDGDHWKVEIDGKPIELAAGETLDTAAIDRVIEGARTIDLAAPADPKRDASKPTATITLTKKASGAGSAATSVVDVIADGDRYWVHDRAQPHAVVVDKARLDAVVELARETIVKKPPEPAPAKDEAPKERGR